MTGRELRAQLRAQQTCNSGATDGVKCEAAELRDDKARRWGITFPELGLVEVVFTPEATTAEALATCAGSIEAIPLPDEPNRKATVAEADELRALIGVMLNDRMISEAERAEALVVALADPIEALRSYRLLAADR